MPTRNAYTHVLYPNTKLLLRCPHKMPTQMPTRNAYTKSSYTNAYTECLHECIVYEHAIAPPLPTRNAHTKCLHKCLHEMPTQNLPTQMPTRNVYTNVLYLNYFPSAIAHTKCPHEMHIPKGHLFLAIGPPNCPPEQILCYLAFSGPGNAK